MLGDEGGGGVLRSFEDNWPPLLLVLCKVTQSIVLFPPPSSHNFANQDCDEVLVSILKDEAAACLFFVINLLCKFF